ncbi:aldehyde dehydrogenase family 3 member B1 isoform X2 [Lingula anatina]|uniref:Aldehyde dehydrogenase n=1 Tax=Lingula anatina TaxID=7574 RepID=A0A1S3J988_LINAN|nr:aldehyde dehydrogenase family 3 member B1 isoform X2 [Lingula anatina]XP_013406966.1 aldehyde dehydrogenase family 3 member B1 isoform X2 [Lingula anatina]|eukprot:XP_013406965.1 aldehyde dehydrogenase family 3 member B1 isoform X2 [Lingula anatina]
MATPNYSTLVASVRKTFNSGKTKSVEWRRKQIQNVIQLIEDKKDEICQVVKKDMRKSEFEAILNEVTLTKNEGYYALNNLDSWVKPEKVKKDLLNMSNDCFIKREPYGVVLIVSPWNYPVQLALAPLIGALAAGNCVIIKPSEMTEATAEFLERTIPQYLDQDCIKVVTGGVPEISSLLKERFDYIFYTGNTMVGKIMMKAAAENLTPVTLELGGKSPVYIDSNCDFDVAAKRILWGKFVNAGQSCIAPDYILCTEEVQARFLDSMKRAIQQFFEEKNPKQSDYYCRIVNIRHFHRLKKMLNGAQIALGGATDEQDLFIEPTVLVDVKPGDAVMQEEIFGPILPIITVNGVEEALEMINEGEKPLALYVFSHDKKLAKRILDCTSSGSACINDVMVQFGLNTLPFGGVGHSGMGGYHGKHSFETFSHRRSCLMKALNMESVNGLRYPPYREGHLKYAQWAVNRGPSWAYSLF